MATCPGCGTSLASEAAAEPEPVETIPADQIGPNPTATGPLVDGESRKCRSPGCGQALSSDAEQCPRCGRAVTLVSPQTPSVDQQSDVVPVLACGEVVLEVGDGCSVDLGRDFETAFASIIEAHTNISRHHATVTRRGMSLYITDQSSTNGTFVDDARLPAEVETEITNATTVRLAATLEICLQRVPNK
ncbi:MAG: FHA domain-containing protein [Solirubrobacterales bacterium]